MVKEFQSRSPDLAATTLSNQLDRRDQSDKGIFIVTVIEEWCEEFGASSRHYY